MFAWKWLLVQYCIITTFDTTFLQLTFLLWCIIHFMSYRIIEIDLNKRKCMLTAYPTESKQQMTLKEWKWNKAMPETSFMTCFFSSRRHFQKNRKLKKKNLECAHGHLFCAFEMLESLLEISWILFFILRTIWFLNLNHWFCWVYGIISIQIKSEHFISRNLHEIGGRIVN